MRMETVKLGIGVALAILIGCDPIDGSGTDGGTEGGVPATTTGGLQPIGADAICDRLIKDCGQSILQANCIATYSPNRVSAACVNLIPTASCADLANSASTVSATCFPGCTLGTLPVCNTDGTITICTDAGTTQRNDCRESCTAIGFTAWTGSCGTEYSGEVAAKPQCWCR